MDTHAAGAGRSTAPQSFAIAGVELAGLVVPVAIAWTPAIAGHLVSSSLTRRDETPHIAELNASYGAPLDAASH